MSLSLIRTALDKRLVAMSPSLATAFENLAFNPVTGTPYQYAVLLPARPDNAVLSARYYREIGIYQVSLMYPQNSGSGTVQARAMALRSHFARGLVLTEGTQQVLIIQTPEISPGRKDGDRWRVDVSIRYQADVYT